MIVQLALIFAFAIHLRHLLQSSKHGLDYSIICCIHHLSDLQGICTDELRLDPTDIAGEDFDKGNDTVSLLAREVCLADCLEVLGLRGSSKWQKPLDWSSGLTTCLSNSPFMRMCCFSKRPRKNALPRSSASVRNLSKQTTMPTTCLRQEVSSRKYIQEDQQIQLIFRECTVKPHLQFCG